MLDGEEREEARERRLVGVLVDLTELRQVPVEEGDEDRAPARRLAAESARRVDVGSRRRLATGERPGVGPNPERARPGVGRDEPLGIEERAREPGLVRRVPVKRRQPAEVRVRAREQREALGRLARFADRGVGLADRGERLGERERARPRHGPRRDARRGDAGDRRTLEAQLLEEVHEGAARLLLDVVDERLEVVEEGAVPERVRRRKHERSERNSRLASLSPAFEPHDELGAHRGARVDSHPRLGRIRDHGVGLADRPVPRREAEPLARGHEHALTPDLAHEQPRVTSRLPDVRLLGVDVDRAARVLGERPRRREKDHDERDGGRAPGHEDTSRTDRTPSIWTPPAPHTTKPPRPQLSRRRPVSPKIKPTCRTTRPSRVAARGRGSRTSRGETAAARA